MLTAPDAQTTPGVVTTGGRASVVASPSLGRSVVVTDGIAAAPSGSVYQVWLLAPSGGATSAGFLPANADGTSATVLAGSLDQAAAVGISLEPVGGSAAPTTTPVFVVQV